MRARSEQGCKLLAEGNHATHRESAGHSLGKGHHIRGHAAGKILTLKCKPLAGTTDAGLHLIDDEQRMVDVTQLTHELDVIGTQRLHAGLTLNEFQNHRRYRPLAIVAKTGLGERLVQGDLVAGAHEFDVGHQRVVGLADVRLPSCGERTHRTAMEAVRHGKNTGGLTADGRQCAGQGATIQLGQLQCRFITLGTRIAEVDLGTFRGTGQFDQLRGELDLRLGSEIIADVSHLGRLLRHGFHPLGMGIAQRIDGDASQEVKVFVAINVPNMRALTVIHNTQRRAEHVHVYLGVLPQPLAVFSAQRLVLLSAHRNSSFPYRLRARPWCRYRRR